MSLTSDEKDALVARLRGHLDNAGVCAIELHPRIYDDAFESVRRVLAPHLPADGAADVSGFRREGRVRHDGVGYVIDAYPFGGSVIDGYHHRLTAVLSNGVALVAEAEVQENGPLVVRLRGDAGAVEAVAHLLGS